MAKGTTLKLFWHVERSCGGTGGYWLHLRAERGRKNLGSCMVSMSSAEKMTPRDLCMAALHLAEQYMKKKADFGVITHSLQYRIDTCTHKWATWSKNKEQFCWNCNGWRRDIEKNLEPSAPAVA